MPENSIINVFCYLEKDSVVFVDLVTEKKTLYSITQFREYIKENKIDDFCIFLANRDSKGNVSPLYKYSLSTKKSKLPITAHHKTLNELIDVCYRICIRLYNDK